MARHQVEKCFCVLVMERFDHQEIIRNFTLYVKRTNGYSVGFRNLTPGPMPLGSTKWMPPVWRGVPHGSDSMSRLDPKDRHAVSDIRAGIGHCVGVGQKLRQIESEGCIKVFRAVRFVIDDPESLFGFDKQVDEAGNGGAGFIEGDERSLVIDQGIFGEEFAAMMDPDMFVHADRDNTVEASLHLAIVFQSEVYRSYFLTVTAPLTTARCVIFGTISPSAKGFRVLY